MPQQKAQIELSAINDTLIKAADAPRRRRPAAARLPACGARSPRLEALASEFDAKLRPRLLERVEEFRAFIDGPESILEAREDELGIIAQAESLLAENVTPVAPGRRCARPAGRRGEPGHRRRQPGGARGAAPRLGRADRHGPAQPAELGPDRLAVRRSQPDRAPDRALQQHAGDRRRQSAGTAAERRPRRDRPHGGGARAYSATPRSRSRRRTCASCTPCSTPSTTAC